jgi:hypothetical protein
VCERYLADIPCVLWRQVYAQLLTQGRYGSVRLMVMQRLWLLVGSSGAFALRLIPIVAGHNTTSRKMMYRMTGMGP